jgi:hypothetical protein
MGLKDLWSAIYSSYSTPQPIIPSDLGTFDILLFSGKDYWFSYAVEWLTWSDFSHVGIVLRSPTWLDPKLTGLYMLESGTETTPDAVSGRIIFGVQITPLEDLLKSYKGKVYCRKLLTTVDTTDLQTKLVEAYNVAAAKPYDDSPTDLLRTELQLKMGDMRRTNAFFCSALVGFLYCYIGLIDSQSTWDSFRPADFNTAGQMDVALTKIGLATLSQLYQLTL